MTARLSPDDVRRRLDDLDTRPGRVLAAAAGTDTFSASTVLALLGRWGPTVGLVFTRRASGMRVHSGQVCLPGGRLEGDETPVEAALREAGEELTVALGSVEVAGTLDQAYTGAPSVVTPIVAWYHGDLEDVAANSGEVAEVLLADLHVLVDPTNHRVKPVDYRGRTYHDDVLDAGSFVVYGPTADITLDLLAWLAGQERDRFDERAADLAHFALHLRV